MEGGKDGRREIDRWIVKKNTTSEDFHLDHKIINQTKKRKAEVLIFPLGVY